MLKNRDVKPCPCCGGMAEVYEFTTVSWAGSKYHVECTDCYLRTDDYRSRLKAIEIWNRRKGMQNE